MHEILEQLYEYFPTSVKTGEYLLIVSDVWKIKISVYKRSNYSIFNSSGTRVKVQLFEMNEDNEFMPGASQDFTIANIPELAEQIERYITFVVAENIKEQGN
ncbi:hypothetical protein SMSP2_02372 [Limihaloglobus sulfuriphilus]|uniref:Uncharacterized protein n=1 Tax=Limihaloglobus sulfuriphilus TaxID=1851148 RepID=A0A1R7T5Y5_9BACT|nr:hypothetical protein [Limihaloglobus sulfuriphilus]AQQ71993.1 hypothetical protein SMSP2_02372 [Limihaloglobus sulfuriphilus]